MKFKQLIFATGTVLLVSIALVSAEDKNCYQPKFSKDDPVCNPGTNLLFTLYYADDGQKTGWCCAPGHPWEKGLLAKALDCQTTKWSAPGNADPCADVPELWLNGGEKIKFDDEIKREMAINKDGKVGEASYCCQKGSLESSLASMYGAEVNEFPHMAKLNLGGDCGGTIYNKRYIITAAHCIVDPPSKKLRPIQASWNVKVGNTLSKADNKPNEYKIVEHIPHPEYSNWEGSPELTHESPQAYNDIALLKVDRDIEFGDTVKSLQIAPKGFEELEYADRVVVPGWGTTDTGSISTNLQKSNFVLRSDEACFSYTDLNSPHPYQFNHTERVMCIGGLLDGIWSPTAGPGDSGGPAICRGAEGTPVHCGIGSYIRASCTDVTDLSKCDPNVFTEVDIFEDWVKGIAGEQDSSTFYKPQLYGEVVKGNKVEHQVRITSATGKSCGGTLVKPDIVVTAASCVASDDGSKKTLSGLKVWTGVKDISGGGSQGESQEANVVAVLNGFKRVGDPVNIEAQGNRIRQTENYYSNNLAVIKLQKPVNINPNKLPKLPGNTQEPSTMAMEYAFPRNTSRGGEMRQREFTILNNDECQKRLDHLEKVKMTSKVEDNMLCAVEKYSGGSLCDRELGGGLICKGLDGQDTLCGVQAYRMCEWQIPNQFVNVAKETDWVQAAIDGLP